MSEKCISIDSVNPVEIFGFGNSNIEIISNRYSKLKVIARGNIIKLIGEEAEIDNCENKINKIIEHHKKYLKLSNENVRDIVNDITPSQINTSDNADEDVILYSSAGKPVKARTKNQRLLKRTIEDKDLIFAVGPAGTGKTYTAVALAVKALKNKEVKRIILCRPAVEAEENLGFLPGDLREKLNPYLQPLYDALLDMINPKKLGEMLDENIIHIAPLAYMRGRTLANAFVILDEAQNATLNQLKMFLTRMGENSKFIVTGDLTQIDLPDKSKSGLQKCIEMLKKVDDIAIINFDGKDIVRHNIVKEIVEIFEKQKNK